MLCIWKKSCTFAAKLVFTSEKTSDNIYIIRYFYYV